MNAWAICDTDGGRQDPVPLVRYIYPTQAAAESARKYHGLDPKWYPVREVVVSLESVWRKAL